MGDEYRSMLSMTESKLKESKILFWCSPNSTLVHLLIEKVMKRWNILTYFLRRDSNIQFRSSVIHLKIEKQTNVLVIVFHYS